MRELPGKPEWYSTADQIINHKRASSRWSSGRGLWGHTGWDHRSITFDLMTWHFRPGISFRGFENMSWYYVCLRTSSGITLGQCMLPINLGIPHSDIVPARNPGVSIAASNSNSKVRWAVLWKSRNARSKSLEILYLCSGSQTILMLRCLVASDERVFEQQPIIICQDWSPHSTIMFFISPYTMYAL